jgi:methionyl-tRNA formyltransferase
VQWAVINGEAETGITTMLMDEGMDTGPMLLQERLPIMPDDTAGTLAARLAELGGRLLVETIGRIKAGTLTPRPQDSSQASMAPLLKKEDGAIDWTMSAGALANRIRGLSPWPGAYTFLGHKRWNLWRAVAHSDHSQQEPGTITNITKHAIHVATGQGLLELTEIQTANSKRMSIVQFLAGHQVSLGERLGPGHVSQTAPLHS